jgi:hypothetical protein
LFLDPGEERMEIDEGLIDGNWLTDGGTGSVSQT